MSRYLDHPAIATIMGDYIIGPYWVQVEELLRLVDLGDAARGSTAWVPTGSAETLLRDVFDPPFGKPEEAECRVDFGELGFDDALRLLLASIGLPALLTPIEAVRRWRRLPDGMRPHDLHDRLLAFAIARAQGPLTSGARPDIAGN